MVDVIKTKRLLMRRWTEDDIVPFAEMNADLNVMRFFPSTMDLEQSAAMVNRIESEFEERGFGLWVLERDGRFLGFTGLSAIPFASPIGSQVEIGWRLAQWAWGNGYATEAAKAATRVGFEEHHLTQIFSFTTRTNVRSAAVMQRIGMKRRIDLDFEHPKTPGWWGQSHVVYQLTFDDWRESASGGLVT